MEALHQVLALQRTIPIFLHLVSLTLLLELILESTGLMIILLPETPADTGVHRLRTIRTIIRQEWIATCRRQQEGPDYPLAWTNNHQRPILEFHHLPDLDSDGE